VVVKEKAKPLEVAEAKAEMDKDKVKEMEMALVKEMVEKDKVRVKEMNLVTKKESVVIAVAREKKLLLIRLPKTKP
jgi:coenzyme F420-reducing hydrogenase gamma subunit